MLTLWVDYDIQILNYLQVRGKYKYASLACPQYPNRIAAERCQLLKIGTSDRVKRDFQTLFETCGLTLQLSDVLCPFQAYYHNMNTNTVDGIM